VAEISDFGPDFKLAPVYATSTDLGLVVFSHVTGNNVSFVVTKVLATEDEVCGWILEPCATDRNLYNLPTGLKIKLFND